MSAVGRCLLGGLLAGMALCAGADPQSAPSTSISVEGRSFSVTPSTPAVVIMANEVAPFLDRTSWRLLTMDGKAITSLGAGQEPWLFLDDGRMNGFSGCNRLAGTYRTKKETLIFLKVGGSTSVCVPVREQEQRFFKVLQNTRRWQVDEKPPFHLQLRDKSGAPLAEFEPVKGNPLR